jgi:hypothetical protein
LTKLSRRVSSEKVLSVKRSKKIEGRQQSNNNVYFNKGENSQIGLI